MRSALAVIVLLAATAACGAAPPLDPNVPDSVRTGSRSTPQARLRLADTLRAREDGRGRLVEPAGIACDAFGRITVADASLRVVQRWDATGDWLDESGTLGSDANQFRRPTAVTRLGANGMAVLDAETRRVVRFDLHGREQGTFVDLTDAALEARIGRVTPVSLAADAGGALVVADADRDRLLVFAFDGRFARELGGFGARPGAFQRLAAVACGTHGELVTCERPARTPGASADSARVRLQWLDPSGRPLAQTWITLSGPRAGRGALAIAVDDSGRVALADELGGSVRVMDDKGHALTEPAKLAAPRALSFAPDGSLYVVEAAGAMVRRWRLVPFIAER